MTDKMNTWLKDAWNFQQDMFQQLGHRKWDRLGGDCSYFLKKLNIAFEICYGKNYHKNDELMKFLENVRPKIYEVFKKFNEFFACTFLNYQTKDGDEQGIIFVLWFGNKCGQEQCVDLSGRNYKSWSDFLKNNKLPKSFILYPKFGRYFQGSYVQEDFVDIIYEESIACSPEKCQEQDTDNGTLVMGTIATGILLFNPVSLPITICAGFLAGVTGLYSFGRNIERLKDIHEHGGGINLHDNETKKIVTDVTLSILTSASMGMKVARRFSLISEASFLIKLGKNVNRANKVLYCINTGYRIVVLIDNYRKNMLSDLDITNLSNIIFFSLSIIVDEALLIDLIKFLNNKCKITIRDDNYLRRGEVSEIIHLQSKKDFPKLLKMIFVDSELPVKLLSDMTELIKIEDDVFDHVSKMLKKGFNLVFSDFLFLDAHLKTLWTKLGDYKIKNKNIIEKEFDISTYDFINNWTHHDGVDINKDFSEFDRRINAPGEIKKKVTETIRMCYKNIESDTLVHREKHLFSELLKLMGRHALKDYSYFINKIEFYCDTFQCLYKELMRSYYVSHFIYTVNHGNIKEDSLPTHIPLNIHNYVYYEAIDKLNSSIDEYHIEFEKFMPLDTQRDVRPSRIVHEFQIPHFDSKIEKENNYSILPLKGYIYEKIFELMPWLIDADTNFYEYDSTAVIKSSENDFVFLSLESSAFTAHFNVLSLFIGDFDRPPLTSNFSSQTTVISHGIKYTLQY